MKKLILIIVLLSVLAMALTACTGSSSIKVLNNANKSCTDITNCVNHTPAILSNLCESVGATHDNKGNCVTK